MKMYYVIFRNNNSNSKSMHNLIDLQQCLCHFKSYKSYF